jgi:nitrous oxidase accessory protein NosD
MTSTDTGSVAAAPSSPRAGGLAGRLGLGLLAALLVAGGGWFLPLWQATLYAPQYPGGLRTVAWGNDVGGDLNEINALNHYVGLGVFDPSDVPEMALWPLALVAAVLAALVAVLVARRWARRLSLVYLWALPLGVLAATQYRLHEFGQDVEPGAAFRMEPFTPWVVGKTTVWNFETWAWPGLGLAAIVVAAALVTFGPRLLQRWTSASPDGGDPEPTAATEPTDGAGQADEVERSASGGRAGGAAALALALVLGGGVAAAGPAQAADHDHGAHDHGAHDQAGAPDHAGAAEARDDLPAPVVGPSAHPSMPAVVEHPPAGDLADLVESTPPGGTLRLRAGTYTGPVVIDEPIVIEGAGLPIVQGDGTGSVITVRAPGTEIRGLVVRGSGPGPTGDPAGVRVEADDVTVEGLVIEDSYVGVAVDSAASVRIEGNHIHGRMGAAIVDEGHAVADDEEHDADVDGATFAPHGDDTDHADHAQHDPAAHGDHAEHADHADHAQHDPAAHGDHADHAEHDPAAHADHGDHAAQGPRSSGVGGPRGDGVWLHDVDHVLVRDNHVQGTRDGVYISFGSGAIVDGNHVHASRYAVHTMFAHDLSLVQNHFLDNLSGVVLMYGSEVLLLRNHVEGSTSASTGFGVILKDVGDVEAVQNLLVGNRVGLHLDGPVESTNETIFKANTVARNTVGVQMLSTARASFAGNSFAANTTQALALGSRNVNIEWAADGWGNFWSSYRGYDAVGHGRGAVAHSEGGSVDRLLARNPELIAISSSPAMRLLRSVEERWGQRSPVLVDELPLTVPVSPALATPAPDPGARALGIALGAGLVLPALATFLVRRPRRSAVRTWRSPRAVPV